MTGKLSTCTKVIDDSCKLALPTLGAWSVAGLLGQPLEYYYYYYLFIIIIIIIIIILLLL